MGGKNKMKGLKPELEEVVSRLSVGDGIVIEHTPRYISSGTMGYVYAIMGSYLTLIQGRNPTFVLERLTNWLTSINVPYESCDNIRVVDPVKTE